MSDAAFMIWVHVIAATPPTIAAVAALVTALQAKRNTQRIMISVNGRIERLQEELRTARAALTQKEPL